MMPDNEIKSLEERFKILLSQNKFWKYGKHNIAQVSLPFCFPQKNILKYNKDKIRIFIVGMKTVFCFKHKTYASYLLDLAEKILRKN